MYLLSICQRLPACQLCVVSAAMAKIARLCPLPMAVWLLKADGLFVAAVTLYLCEWRPHLGRAVL